MSNCDKSEILNERWTRSLTGVVRIVIDASFQITWTVYHLRSVKEKIGNFYSFGNWVWAYQIWSNEWKWLTKVQSCVALVTKTLLISNAQIYCSVAHHSSLWAHFSWRTTNKRERCLMDEQFVVVRLIPRSDFNKKLFDRANKQKMWLENTAWMRLRLRVENNYTWLKP